MQINDESDNERTPESTVPSAWQQNMPDLVQQKNWNTSSTACLVHVVMDGKVCKFAIECQHAANLLELQAQQTPKDKFWTIAHWMYNVGYGSDWFDPKNEFIGLHLRVAGVNPCELDQFRSLKSVMEK